MQNDYTNKIVLVTGGTSGIGKVTAIAFANAGDEEGNFGGRRIATGGRSDALSVELSGRRVLLRQQQARREDEDRFSRHPS